MGCNAVRLPRMKPPLRQVVETLLTDDVIRVELLACGHKKTTFVQRDRPAYRRRCGKCLAATPKPVVEEDSR